MKMYKKKTGKTRGLKKPFTVLLIFSMILLSTIPYVSAQGSSWVTLELEKIYGLHGENIELSVFSNASSVNVRIFDPTDNLIYNQDWVSNTSRQIPISEALPYGTYKIKGIVEYSTTTILFTVLDVSSWTPASFPHVVEHNDLTYTFYANWTVKAGDLRFNLAKLAGWVELYDLDVTPLKNSMNFLVRLKKLPFFAMDITFSFIHKGCKILINGTQNEPRTFTINFPQTTLQKVIHGIKRGNTVFDWSDIPKQAFSYDNGLLTINIPENFFVDPYIFEDGFETNDFSLWDATYEDAGCTVETLSIDPHCGTYHAHYECDSDSTNAYSEFTDSGGLSETELYTRIVFKAKSLPDSGSWQIVGHMGNGGGQESAIYATYTGGAWYFQVRGRDGESMQGDTSSIEIVIDDEFFLELGIYVHATEGWHRLWIDGNLEAELADKDTDNRGNMQQVEVGCRFQNGGTTKAKSIYVDCVIVNDAYIGVEEEVTNYLIDLTGAGIHTELIEISWSLELRPSTPGIHGTNKLNEWSGQAQHEEGILLGTGGFISWSLEKIFSSDTLYAELIDIIEGLQYFGDLTGQAIYTLTIEIIESVLDFTLAIASLGFILAVTALALVVSKRD